MATDNNFGFLAKQLAQSEFPGSVAIDVDGGCYLLGSAFHAVIWDVTAVDDAETFITVGMQAAEEQSLEWGSTILLTTSGMEKTQAFKDLTEALFVYSFPDTVTAANGLPAPNLIQAIGKPLFKGQTKGIEICVANVADENFAGLLAPATPEESVRFSGFSPAIMNSTVELHVANAGGKPVGVVACMSTGLVCRVVHVWVEPDQRRKGLAQSLVAKAYASSQERGELLFTCWASPKGTLRYFLSKLGFEEQVRAHYFVAE